MSYCTSYYAYAMHAMYVVIVLCILFLSYFVYVILLFYERLFYVGLCYIMHILYACRPMLYCHIVSCIYCHIVQIILCLYVTSCV